MDELLTMEQAPGQDATVKVEISTQLLAGFIEQGLLCVADLRCMDSDSRNQIKKLCLSVCARNSFCGGNLACARSLDCMETDCHIKAYHDTGYSEWKELNSRTQGLNSLQGPDMHTAAGLAELIYKSSRV
ncbi:hypothetical protein [Motiliproteus sp. MSK22-1]|uniref:hypothetical protein n=1 Tax=Motiliproteus sp. MSK22-1 TaxID=1897630 RepID=UPI0009754450|nr:hypothetical protein [Motiliproteus sp. MSK22-1]OMH33577.1 hypothetical protein BGP75_11140 [Motiliproteus sp. MSK22-1]